MEIPSQPHALPPGLPPPPPPLRLKFLKMVSLRSGAHRKGICFPLPPSSVPFETSFPAAVRCPLLSPSPSGSCQKAPLSSPPTPLVTRGAPVHYLKCILWKFAHFEKTPRRAILRVREHWHNNSALGGKGWRGRGERRWCPAPQDWPAKGQRRQLQLPVPNSRGPCQCGGSSGSVLPGQERGEVCKQPSKQSDGQAPTIPHPAQLCSCARATLPPLDPVPFHPLQAPGAAAAPVGTGPRGRDMEGRRRTWTGHQRGEACRCWVWVGSGGRWGAHVSPVRFK